MQRPTWNSIGARGQAAGEVHSVALFRMAVSKPPMASTLPAGTSCSHGAYVSAKRLKLIARMRARPFGEARLFCGQTS